MSEVSVQHISWGIFLPYFVRQWRQGQHVTLVGPTGSGKSVLALELTKGREYYVLLLTKGRDETASKFIRKNELEVTENWPPSGFSDKIALWPKFNGVDSFTHQSNVMRNAINGYRKRGKKIDGIYAEGGWTVLIDEVMYFDEELHLNTEMRMLWTQGRSNGISLIAGTQRPRDVPQLMLNQWNHFFCFQTSDEYEIKRLAAIGGNISSKIKANVQNLAPHEFLYINRQTNAVCVSKVERISQ